MKECCKKYLDEQFGGDEEVVGEIYAEYVSSMGEKSGELERAFAAKDWVAVDRAAHAVKGNALAVGDQDVADAAIALRGAAKLGDEAQAGQLVAKLMEFGKLL